MNSSNFATYSGGSNTIAANGTSQNTLAGATGATNVVLTDPGTITLAIATSVNSLVIINDNGATGQQ